MFCWGGAKCQKGPEFYQKGRKRPQKGPAAIGQGKFCPPLPAPLKRPEMPRAKASAHTKYKGEVTVAITTPVLVTILLLLRSLSFLMGFGTHNLLSLGQHRGGSQSAKVRRSAAVGR